MHGSTARTETGLTAYREFIAAKSQSGMLDGFAPVWMPDFLFPFQRALVEWALKIGRGAIFADCGVGKTPMQLVWAENVVQHTARPVLVLTPLAVAAQTVAEGAKFGIECHRSRDGQFPVGASIIVTNYQQLHKFDPSRFVGVVCDESGILKNSDGATRDAVTEFMRRIPYRLLCTATAAPNDYVELGTSSEALGYLGHMDMLNRFFKNDQNTSDTGAKWRTHGGGLKWRFKGHAETPFWRWVCSWARAMRKPSDLGFDDDRFQLPPLIERETIVEAKRLREGMLFALAAHGLAEQREERRRTITERCEKVAELVDHNDPAVSWCQLNDEGDLLEKLIRGGVQVSGKDTDEAKEEKFLAFARGEIRALITKPVIGAWGLNWQHCAHATMFASHSFEQYYQGVRRCWRFGQTRPVIVDNVVSDGERGVLANLQRKSAAADRMFAELTRLMNDAVGIDRSIVFTGKEQVPPWLSSISA